MPVSVATISSGSAKKRKHPLGEEGTPSGATFEAEKPAGVVKKRKHSLREEENSGATKKSSGSVKKSSSEEETSSGTAKGSGKKRKREGAPPSEASDEAEKSFGAVKNPSESAVKKQRHSLGEEGTPGIPKKSVERKKQHPPGAAVTKKRKQSRQKPTTTEEVESIGGTDSQEHARILKSVTGKISKLPLESEVEGSEQCDSENKEEEKAMNKTEAKEGVDAKASKLAAAEYLELWESDRKKWAFRKKTQYWLLQNMYEKKKVSKAHFKLLVEYLAGLQGNQRGLAVERAKQVMAQNESGRDTVSESKIQFKRASKVLKVLTEN